MYDWAASAMQTTIMVAVFPIYFVKVAGADLAEGGATQRLATLNTLALVVIALVSPVLGAVSDYGGNKKRFIAAFMGSASPRWPGSSSSHTGDLALGGWLFVLALIGVAGASSSTSRCCPTSPGPTRSTGSRPPATPWATSAAASCSRFNLAWIQKPGWFGLPAGPASTRPRRRCPRAGASLAWRSGGSLFSIPLFRRVPEPPRRLEPDERRGESPVRAAFVRLGETFRELRGYRQAFLMLLAFLIYNDGIQTIIKMATAYGTEIGIGQSALIGAILLVQFVGIPCSFLFGMLAGRIGAKRALFLGLLAYTVDQHLGVLHEDGHAFLRAGRTGGDGPGRDAGAQPVAVRQHDPAAQESGEFFGFFSVFEKFAGIFGPLIFAGTIAATGSSRNAILIGHRVLRGRARPSSGSSTWSRGEAAARADLPISPRPSVGLPPGPPDETVEMDLRQLWPRIVVIGCGLPPTTAQGAIEILERDQVDAGRQPVVGLHAH